jgi:hypothetical protein
LLNLIKNTFFAVALLILAHLVPTKERGGFSGLLKVGVINASQYNKPWLMSTIALNTFLRT